jgi:hypothetical protein
MRVARAWEVSAARKVYEFRGAIYSCCASVSIQQNGYLLSKVIVVSVGSFPAKKNRVCVLLVRISAGPHRQSNLGQEGNEG